MKLHTKSWDTFLYITAEGELDFDAAVLFSRQTAERAAEKQISKILIDYRLVSGDLSDIERINVAVRGADYATAMGVQPTVAIVGGPPNLNGLTVVAAQSLGAAVEVFADIPEAIAWLTRSPEDLWR